MAEDKSPQQSVPPTLGRASIAALNNAWWCRSVCRAHGDPGEIDTGTWSHVAPVPRFYPNAVSLECGETAAARIRDLVRDVGGRSWSVKDSFSQLDLAQIGAHVLFDAQWLWLEPPAEAGNPDGWERITTADGLREWDRAWSDGESTDLPPVFVPALLADESVAIWALRPGPTSDIEAGAVTSRSPGAVGLSNCFSRDPGGLAPAVAAVSRLAATFAPGLPQVGYERAEDCAPYSAIGFDAVGSLRVWIKD